MTLHPDHEQKFIESVRRTLDDAAESLDASALSRLNQARNKAMETGARKRLQWIIWPAWGVIASVALILLLFPVFENKPQSIKEVALTADTEIISDSLGLDFYRDLYFYYWLSVDGRHAE
jgi:type VI protein secretion system component VasF